MVSIPRWGCQGNPARSSSGFSLRKSSNKRKGSNSLVSPKPNARRNRTPAPSMVGCDGTIRVIGRMDMVAPRSLSLRPMMRAPAAAPGFRLPLPVHVESLNRLGELGRRDREVLRRRGELAQRGDLLLRRRRGLLGALRRRLGDPRDFFHPPHHLADPPRLPFGLARKGAGELHGGVQVAE